MKFSKKTLAMLLALVMLLAALPLMPLTATAETVGDFEYEIKSGEAEITDYTGAGGDVKIPSTLGGYPVTSIGEDAFAWCGSLTSITIPAGVTSIGDRAFAYCTQLSSITIPAGVTSIGDGAFYDCTQLTSIMLPAGVTSIGEDAFAYCTRLSSITIPDSVTSIGDDAFEWCDSLQTVYYGGTKAQWDAITIGWDNEKLTGADIVFESDGPSDISAVPGDADGDEEEDTDKDEDGDDEGGMSAALKWGLIGGAGVLVIAGVVILLIVLKKRR